MEISVKLPVDSDGFIEYECPYCKKIFRLNKNLFNDSENYFSLHCPYCGIESEIGRFYTTAFVEYSQKITQQFASEELNKIFKSMERQTRNSLVKMKFKPTKSDAPSDLKLYAGIDKLEHCNICDNDYKIEVGFAIPYCPYCGEIK